MFMITRESGNDYLYDINQAMYEIERMLSPLGEVPQYWVLNTALEIQAILLTNGKDMTEQEFQKVISDYLLKLVLR